MARQIVIDIVGDATKYSRTTKDAIRVTDDMGRTLTGLDRNLQGMTRRDGIPGALLGGVGIGAGLGVFSLVERGLSAVTDVIGDSITAASDLGEQQSKVTAVFKDQAGEMLTWARTLDSSFGLSERAALTAAGNIGNLATSLGLSGDAAVNLSQDITELAGDLSSFNNVPVEDVLTALKAGLVGETEPMRRFGVLLSASAVNAEALASGLAATASAVSEQDKVQARYNIIMRQTANAQGDAARTADTFAGKQRRVNASLENLSARLGQVALTIADPLLGAFSALLGVLEPQEEAYRRVTDAINEYSAAQGESVAPTMLATKALEDFLAGQQQDVAAFRAKWEAALGMWARANQSAAAFGTALDWVHGVNMDFARSLNLTADGVGKLALDIAASGGTVDDFNAAIAALGPVFMGMERHLGVLLPGAWSKFTAAAEESTGMTAEAMARVRRAIASLTFKVENEESEWSAAWQRMEQWATDPMRSTAKMIKSYTKQAVENARQAAEDGQPKVARRWRRIAQAMKSPIVAAMVDVGASVDEAIAALWRVQATFRTVRGIIGRFVFSPFGGNNANGTDNWRGGVTMVGERGPELVNLPRGSRILSNAETARAGGGGRSYNVTVNVAPGGDLVEAGRRMVEAIRQYERRSGAVWRAT